MLKNILQNSDSKENNTENEKPPKKLEIKSELRKRDRHALENIIQNKQDLKVLKSNDNLSITNKISEKIGITYKNKTKNSNVEYQLEQRILIFKSTNGNGKIKTGIISPIVDIEATGPRQSLRNLPEVKPPKIQRRNSTAKRNRIKEGSNFANISTEYKQYRLNFLKHITEYSWMYVIDRSFLQTFDPIIKNRNRTIMWLIDINNMFQERCGVLLNSVRIFDTVLASVLVPKRLYVLVASTAFWISAKFENAQFTSIKHFLRSNDSYAKEQYFAMEFKILHLLNYNVFMVDPTLVVDYICMRLEKKKPNTGNSDMLYHSAYFFLELFSLDCMYTTTDPIIMARAALRSSMKLLPMYRNNVTALDNIIQEINAETRPYRAEELDVQSRMLFLLSLACERTHTFHDLFQKYLTADYCQISKELRYNFSPKGVTL